ncbi:UNVERIFIED_CONTAM: hypothetical protein GTU68_055208 [Idotea baltica]|nr:hypothetical protein [Idotea baltica]
MGNDFLGLYIQSSESIERAKSSGLAMKQEGDVFTLQTLDGYKIHLINKPQPQDEDPVKKVSLASSNLPRSVAYWRDLAGMTVFEKSSSSARLGYCPKQAQLVLEDIGGPVEHAKAFGRIAFACLSAELKQIEALVNEKGEKVLTPFISLDTDGKASVQVVILADPDGHEICFVGDEGFRELSQVDPKGDELMREAMKKDKSKEWFAQKGGKGAA